jgi:hypothetical protein
MKRAVMIMVEVDDIDHKRCSLECTYLDKFFEYCKLFNTDLNERDEDTYFRCEQCLIDMNAV